MMEEEKNPFREIWEESFSKFGYESDQECVVCGNKPARIEPRFNCAVCIDHFDLSPTRISRLIKERKNEK